MNRTVSTLAAATAGVGLAVASTSAKAFVIAPALAAGILAGGVLGGAAIGAAANNRYTYPNGYYAARAVTTGAHRRSGGADRDGQSHQLLLHAPVD